MSDVIETKYTKTFVGEKICEVLIPSTVLIEPMADQEHCLGFVVGKPLLVEDGLALFVL